MPVARRPDAALHLLPGGDNARLGTPGRSRMNSMKSMGRAPGGAASPEAWTLEVVARVKRGDRPALRQLYARHAPVVRSHVAPLLRDAGGVDDVVQTTFLRLAARLDAYEPGAVPFEAWLLRIAREAALDEEHRRRAAAPGSVLQRVA